MPITDAPVHATLAVADLDRARAWYSDKLGWEPLSISEVAGTLIYKVGDSYPDAIRRSSPARRRTRS